MIRWEATWGAKLSTERRFGRKAHHNNTPFLLYQFIGCKTLLYVVSFNDLKSPMILFHSYYG